MIRRSNTFAALNQRPNLVATIANGFQTLEHKYDPYVT
jgi:hypothetical protein